MKKLFFVFCKGDLMLEKLPDGTYTIPYGENAPTETKPWTNMMNVESAGRHGGLHILHRPSRDRQSEI